MKPESMMNLCAMLLKTKSGTILFAYCIFLFFDFGTWPKSDAKPLHHTLSSNHGPRYEVLVRVKTPDFIRLSLSMPNRTASWLRWILGMGERRKLGDVALDIVLFAGMVT